MAKTGAIHAMALMAWPCHPLRTPVTGGRQRLAGAESGRVGQCRLRHRVLPACHQFLGAVMLQGGHKAALGLPQGRQLFGALVHAGGQTGQIGRTQRGGFHAGGAHHGNAQQVGLELHQQVVHTGPAIHAQLAHCRTAIGHRVAAHGLQQGRALVGNGFQRRAGDVGDGAATRQTGDGAAGVGLPVRGTQAGEGGHHHHAAAVGHAFGQLLHLAAVLDGTQAVAQPLHHRAAHEHAAFQRKLGLGASLCGRGGQQTVGRGLELAAGVHQHEAAGAIGVLGHAGREAGLAEEGALLVAGHAADGNLAAQDVGGRVAEVGCGGQHLGQQAAGNAQRGQQIGVPLVGVDVEQHGAAGVADIGHMAPAAGELPDQPAVHGAEGQVAGIGRGAGAGHVVQQPLQLAAGEVGVDQQTGLLLDGVGHAGFAQRGTDGLGTAVLPDDGMVDGGAGLAVPHHGGFTLVGHANGMNIFGK